MEQEQAVLSILDPVEHRRVLDDFDNVCLTAGVLPKYVHQSATLYCGPKEIDWIRNFHENRNSSAGLFIEGVEKSVDRCMAISGALIRNFIDARVMPMNTVLESKSAAEPTCLLIPNFCIDLHGKNFAAHELQDLYDVLVQRFILGRPTVLCAESYVRMAEAYGAMMAQHIKNNFKIIKS